jgi:hypothetical protein
MVPASVPSLTQTDWSVLEAKIDLALSIGDTNERLRFELIKVTWADAASVTHRNKRVGRNCFIKLFYSIKKITSLIKQRKTGGH